MTTYSSMLEADAAAPVGHYVMFHDTGGLAEWCVMSPEQRADAHAYGGDSPRRWRTWARKEAPGQAR